MSVLSGDTIRDSGIFEPCHERSKHTTGTSFGLSMCGYDVCLDQDVVIYPGFTTLASTREKFFMPLDVVAIVHDKSTWARVGVQVQNTVAEPGWTDAYLTLELTFCPVIPTGATRREIMLMRRRLASGRFPPIRLKAGTPIAQVLNHRTDKPTKGYADGKYQAQARGPQPAIFEMAE